MHGYRYGTFTGMGYRNPSKELRARQWAEACRLVGAHPKILTQYQDSRSYVFERFCKDYWLDHGEALTLLGQANLRIREALPLRLVAEVHQIDFGGMSFRQASIYLAYVQMACEDGFRLLAPARTVAQRSMLLDLWGWDRPSTDPNHKTVVETTKTLLRWGLLDEYIVGLPKRRGHRPTASIVELTEHPLTPSASFTQKRHSGPPPKTSWGFQIGNGWDRTSQPLKRRWSPPIPYQPPAWHKEGMTMKEIQEGYQRDSLERLDQRLGSL